MFHLWHVRRMKVAAVTTNDQSDFEVGLRTYRRRQSARAHGFETYEDYQRYQEAARIESKAPLSGARIATFRALMLIDPRAGRMFQLQVSRKRTLIQFLESMNYKAWPGFARVSCPGGTFRLSPTQARMIRDLAEAAYRGEWDVPRKALLAKHATPTSQWRCAWRGKEDARKALLEKGGDRFTVRLKDYTA
jgi:hypothetical protein